MSGRNNQSSKLDRILKRQGEMAEDIAAIRRVALASLIRERRLIREKETLVRLFGQDEIARRLRAANEFLSKPVYNRRLPDSCG